MVPATLSTQSRQVSATARKADEASVSSQQPTLQRPRAHHQSRQPARDPSADAPSLTRRAAVGAAVGAALWPRALDAGAAKPRGDTSDWSSPGLAAPVDPNAPLFFKTPSGVPVQVLAEGTGGREARAGERLLVDFVVRRSNGYFIYSTVEGVSFQPRDVPTGPVVLTLGDGSVVPGLEDGIAGMRQGSKRRILVPPQLGYSSGGGEGAAGLQPRMPTFATQRQLDNHRGEGLLFEVQLLRVVG